MRLSLALLLGCLCWTGHVFAQSHLNGLWEGTMTVGGLQSTQGYPIEMVLEQRGKKVSGRTYLHLSKDRIIEMAVEGRIYDDRSIYFDEIEFINNDGEDWIPPFMRKYQVAWRRGIYENTINGFWQEIKPEVFETSRERGRIVMKKVQAKKA